MSNVYVESKGIGFFNDDNNLLKVAISGGLFAALAYLFNRFIFFITCSSFSVTKCFDNNVALYRVGLIIFGILALGYLARLGVARSILVVIPVVVILWNIIVSTGLLPVDALIYFILGSLLFALFSWINRVYNWIISALIMVIVTVLLMLI